MFDPDRAGQSAAERFAPLFGSRWRPVRLPNNLDLAELATGAKPVAKFDMLVGRARAAAWQAPMFTSRNDDGPIVGICPSTAPLRCSA